MKTLVERLKEQLNKSEEFTRTNFGLQIGDSFPELFREITADERLATFLTMKWVMQQFSGSRAIARLDPTPGGQARAARDFDISGFPLSFLYWGIEIGRQMEREQAAAEKSSQVVP